MKIVTWNVNGLRAALRKGIATWITDEAPDVLCMQETRVLPEQLTDEQRTLPGSEGIWNAAEKQGYSGVATWAKTTPVAVE
ncbi:MAG: endonuclease/exonuclease/phosphatase family protein, partial [Anaerolineales bacterium]|nr:endonuclease/exonuclease/phosphatase family protein [Anaerolineales bacterium]